jgi:hypothetical protein
MAARVTWHRQTEHTERMTIPKPPPGTRGARTPPGLVNKVLMPVMMRIRHRGSDRFQGMDLLYLTAVGARSERKRTNPVASFDDGRGGWYVVASAGGAAHHPAWTTTSPPIPTRYGSSSGERSGT